MTVSILDRAAFMWELNRSRYPKSDSLSSVTFNMSSKSTDYQDNELNCANNEAPSVQWKDDVYFEKNWAPRSVKTIGNLFQQW